jgi:transcriptional regulator with XRE-family HTH domain
MSPTLGHQLRRARERQYLSLADLAHETRIPVSRLRDLENDDYSAFGGVAYVRMFLKAYANRLEVDADETLAQMAPPRRVDAAPRRNWLRRSGPWTLPSMFNRARRNAKPEPAWDPLGRELKATATVCAITLLLGASYLIAQAYQQHQEEIPATSGPIPRAEAIENDPTSGPEIRQSAVEAPLASLPAEAPKRSSSRRAAPVLKAELVK